MQVRAKLPPGVDGWGYSLKGMMGMVVTGGVLITATYFLLQRTVVAKVGLYIVQSSDVQTEAPSERETEKEAEIGNKARESRGASSSRPPVSCSSALWTPRRLHTHSVMGCRGIQRDTGEGR